MPLELVDRDKRNKVFGVIMALVTDNQDPSGKYRVKVKYPWLSNGDNETSGWVRVCSFNAGKDRGMFCLPEVGDEVLVAFEHGDMDRPYIIGSLWNNSDTPHVENKKDGGQKGKNNARAFKSRSGHVLEFCDDKENKKEKVTLKTKAGHRIVLDDTDSAKKVEIYDDEGNNYILLDAQNKKITMETKTGDILIKAKEKITLEAKQIETKSDQDTKMKVGANFEMKASSNMTLNASGSGEVKSSGTLTVKGSTVNIN